MPKIKTKQYLYLTVTLLALSACVTDKLSLKPNHSYTFSGIDNNDEVREEIKSYLKDYLPKEKISKDSDEARRHEDYQERYLKAQLIKVLNSEGYYDAKIQYQDNTDQQTGNYLINLGEPYKINSITIMPPAYQSFAKTISIMEGQVIDAELVLMAQKDLYKAVIKGKCYFQSNISHQVVLDKTNKNADITFNIATQPEATFGKVVFIGQEKTKETYLNKLIPFKEGDCYSVGKLQTFKEKILSTGLFSRAEINQPETIPTDHIIPITVNVHERASRTVRTGISYYTDEGIGLILGWVHRNFLGAAEKLETKLKLSQLQQKLSIDLTKPFFLRDDQSLSLSASLERQDTDAFEELSIGSSANINRAISKNITGSTGISFELSRITDQSTNIEESYGLVSFPNSLNFDNRDNKLDPRKGWNLKGTIEPFIDALGTSNPFLKTRLYASTYYGFGENTTLATRASVGTIIGADIDNIPATERFYSGGGGSIRGFGYQKVGPVTNNDPTGGASVIEGSTELRFKLTDKIGAVTFVDGGNVSEEVTPQFSDFSIGAGVGLRYYTSFGPLRFDVATPLTNKENTDQNYQIYISIGQAF